MASCAKRGPAFSTVASKRLFASDVFVILILIRRVDAQEVVIVGDFVDQDVVDESAVSRRAAPNIGLGRA